MTVAELIEALKKQKQDAKVVVFSDYDCRSYPLVSIKPVKIVKKTGQEYVDGIDHPKSTLFDAIRISSI